jgi:hypothetical protein
MKALPRESLTSTAVATSSAPTRVSRTIVGGGSNARVVTLDRNASITYDAREHRFVNGASLAQAAGARSPQKTDAMKEGLTGEGVGQGRVEARAAAGMRVPAANVRVPAASMRAAAPPSRVMAPPPPRASTGAYGGGWDGGWSQGASSRGSASHPAPASSASHASSAGSSGHPH